MDATPEEWREIPGFDGYYEVSNLGQVRSWRNGKWGRASEPALMNPSPMNTGYLRVTLRHDGKDHYRLVHHLVLEAFHGPQPEGCQGAHLDGNRENAKASNLVWASPRENSTHKLAHGTYPGMTPSGPDRRLTREEVIEIKVALASGEKQRMLAERYGVHVRTIARIAQGATWRNV